MGYESWFQAVPVVTPVAGSPFVRKVPGETFERPVSLRYTLTTSAFVANRFPGLDITDGDDNILIRVLSSAGIPASTQTDLNFFLDSGSANIRNNGSQWYPMPKLLLPPGFKIKTPVLNLDPADTITTVQLFVQRYPSSEWASSPGSSPYSPDVELERG